MQTEHNFRYLLVMIEHAVKGSPLNPWEQVQVGKWFRTVHTAF